MLYLEIGGSMPVEGVRVVTEGARGCGYRKKGGTYLICDGISQPCPALPLEVSRCPCCDAGIKPSRSWAWFSPKLFFKFPCPPDCEVYQERGRCEPFKQDRAGILWIGGRFYKTPKDWSREAKEMGVSRRISQIPKDLVVGETWVFVGHREAVEKMCPTCEGDGEDYESGAEPDECGKYECKTCEGTGAIKVPGVFHAFKPTRIEKVVDEDITEEEVAALAKRGITPVVVNRVDEDGNSVDEQGEPLPNYPCHICGHETKPCEECGADRVCTNPQCGECGTCSWMYAHGYRMVDGVGVDKKGKKVESYTPKYVPIKETVKERVLFVRCSCGFQCRALKEFVANPDYEWTCPECNGNLMSDGADEIDYIEGLPEVLPNGVERHGHGLNMHFTGLKE
jgi:hypothetical protein